MNLLITKRGRYLYQAPGRWEEREPLTKILGVIFMLVFLAPPQLGYKVSELVHILRSDIMDGYTDLALSPEEVEERYKVATPLAEEPKYPYGTSLSLDESILEKMGVDHSDWAVGDMLLFIFMH